MADTLYLITLFPLLGFLVNGLFGRWLSERQSGMVASGMVLGSFVLSAQLLLVVIPTKAEVYPERLSEHAPAGAMPGGARLNSFNR